MKLNSIVRGMAQVVALALLVAPNSVAQQGGESERVASKARESAKAPAKKVNRKLAMNSGEPSRVPARSLDARCAPTGAAGKVPVARLVNVDGNVLVSVESGLAAGQKGQALQEGSRVTAMTDSSLMVRYCDGCEVFLKANQRIEISLSELCLDRLAQVESILVDPAMVETVVTAASGSLTAAVMAGVVPASTPLIGGIGLSGALATIRDRLDESVSPN